MLSLTPWRKSHSPADEARVLPHSLFAGDIDPLFAQLVNGFFGDRDGLLVDPVRVDVRETDESYVVRAEVPGIEPEALDIQLTGDLLVLSGEKKDERKDEDGRGYSERRFGSFRRAIRLPVAVDAEQVKAEHKNGVVTITLTKAASVRPKRITVRTT